VAEGERGWNWFANKTKPTATGPM